MQNNLQPNLAEPTAAEVAEQVAQAEMEYGIQLSGAEAVQYTKLNRELGWWLTLDDIVAEPSATTNEKTAKLQALVREQSGRELSTEEAREELRAVSEEISKSEKDRIAEEIRAIVAAARTQQK